MNSKNVYNPFGLDLIGGVTQQVGDASYQRRAADAVGAFLIGELERLDPVLHEPLVQFTYGRDMPLRTDATIGDELTSFMNISYAAVGGANANGKNFVSKEGDVYSQMQVDYGRETSPFHAWAIGASYGLLEAASAAQVNRPLDAQLVEGVQLKHQMDADEMVYVGDTSSGEKGLCNSDKVTLETAAGPWATATAEEIVNDIDTLMSHCWTESAVAVIPGKILLPPTKFALLSSKIMSNAAQDSVLSYLKRNNIYTHSTGNPLDIQPVKWLENLGAGSTGRMVCYTQDKNFVRFPLTPLLRTAIQYDLMKIKWAHYGRMGRVEYVKTETVRYMDNI